jgi:hypothetical protein
MDVLFPCLPSSPIKDAVAPSWARLLTHVHGSSKASAATDQYGFVKANKNAAQAVAGVQV